MRPVCCRGPGRVPPGILTSKSPKPLGVLVLAPFVTGPSGGMNFVAERQQRRWSKDHVDDTASQSHRQVNPDKHSHKLDNPRSGIEMSSACYVCCRSTFTRQPPQAFLCICAWRRAWRTCRFLEVGEPS